MPSASLEIAILSDCSRRDGTQSRTIGWTFSVFFVTNCGALRNCLNAWRLEYIRKWYSVGAL